MTMMLLLLFLVRVVRKITVPVTIHFRLRSDYSYFFFSTKERDFTGHALKEERDDASAAAVAVAADSGSSAIYTSIL